MTNLDPLSKFGGTLSIMTVIIPPIPRETARAAGEVFGRSNFYIQVGEHLESLLEGIQMEYVLETEKSWGTGGDTILALVTLFQFVDGLTDEQATEATRTRIDWKFAMHLPLKTVTFNQSALSRFPRRIVIDAFRLVELQKMIDRFIKLNPPFANEIDQLENLDLLAAVCWKNRMEYSIQAMCQTLEIVAGKYPQWLRKVALSHWYGRYNRLSPGQAATLSLCGQENPMEAIGADIHYLITQMIQSGTREMNELPEVKSLYRVWIVQFDKWNRPQTDKGTGLTLKDCAACYNNAG